MSTATITNGAVLDRHAIPTEGIEHLDLEVLILSEPQRQGDILIIPCAPRNEGTVIPPKGILIVQGESTGGNAHILHTLTGECQWRPSPRAATQLLQGWLTVPENASATLIHTQEHNVLGIGTGCYEIRRQREMAGEWRRVTD